MKKAKMVVAWALVRDDGQVAEFTSNSVLVFESEQEARKFCKRVVGRTQLRGRYTPRPLVGRLLARVQGRPLAVRLEAPDGANYTVLWGVRPDAVFDAARTILAA